MKLLTRFFTRLYQYSTIFIVVGAPLFFIPKTGFSPDVTYHIVMMLVTAIALFSYVFVALKTRTWHSVSRLEFISYFVFSISVIASSLFSKNPQVTFFGEAFNQFSGAALLTLPVIMYLVRALPESIRYKLKYVMAGILGISSFVFITALMLGGKFLTVTKTYFSGFSSSLSFAAYIGFFSVACFFYIAKGKVAKKWKMVIATTALLFIALVVTLSTQNSIRPNLKSTLLVGKDVLTTDGVFGIGAGNFPRAWQLHRPQDVINSPYFSYDFVQGSDTMSTLFVTIGILGLVAFMMLTLSALYSTFVSYRQNREGREPFILGLLFLAILYFIVAAWVVPFSYAMLVVWMSVSGLGFAKARLTEFHPSKKLVYLFVPVVLLLIVNAVITVNKARAFSTFTTAQTAPKLETAEALTLKAAQAYQFDGFYRVLVEYAITSNRNLLSSDSQDQEALKNTYLKKSQDAVNYGLKAVELNKSNYQNYVSLGRAYELAIPFDKDNAFARAKAAYQEATKLYPDNPYLYLMLARLETSAGTKEGVRAQLTEALKKKQNFADALYLMSQLEASESKIDEAITYAIEAIKSAPNDPATYTQAGLLFYGKKDYENAVYALKTALEKDPNNANVAYFLALTLRDGGRPDLARPLAEELLRRNPGNADLEKFNNTLVRMAQPAPPAPQASTKGSTKKQ
jgi:tetratricopeptide (TPR) repeat protein